MSTKSPLPHPLALITLFFLARTKVDLNFQVLFFIAKPMRNIKIKLADLTKILRNTTQRKMSFQGGTRHGKLNNAWVTVCRFTNLKKCE